MEIDPYDFDRLRGIVLKRSAIVLEPGKEYLVESRLAPILRKHEIASFRDLVDTMRSPTGEWLVELVVDAMTTNETSFFRDVHPWQSLQSELLPKLIESRADHRRLTIWCAASSSGQEPYTLAMLLHEHFPEVANSWQVRIIGTDLSPTMVDKSRAGLYSQIEVNRGLPATMLMKYFARAGNSWQIRDDLRSMTEFRVGNLIEEAMWAQIPLVDAVFIRNVLIYFDKPTREGILDRVSGRLRSDGFLMLGSSETAVGIGDVYERRQCDKTVYFVPARGAADGGLLSSVRTALAGVGTAG